MNMNRLRYISFSVLMALSTLTLAQNQNDADGDYCALYRISQHSYSNAVGQY